MEISSGQHVCLLWGASNSTDDLQKCFQELSSVVGSDGRIQLENIERFLMSNHKQSSFDVVLSGYLAPACVIHTAEVLEELARILKPNGKLVLSEPTIEAQDSSQLRTLENLTSALKLAGFIDVEKIDTVPFTQDDSTKLKSTFNTENEPHTCKVRCKKPSYEVGASTALKLSFGKKSVTAKPVDVQTEKVWSLSAMDMMDDDVDLIDTDDLLDENDLKRPNPETLRVCGTTGKRKACKNCSCGLAEELDNEAQGKQTAAKPTSACGSCYLGDAFRCASCPYLGMPAFKPGEKVVITNTS